MQPTLEKNSTIRSNTLVHIYSKSQNYTLKSK